MKFNRNITILIICFFTFSCGKKSPCFKGAGDANTEIAELNDVFSSLSVHDEINVVLTHSLLTEVKIEAGENLIPYVETKVVNGSLEIRNNNKCDFLRGFKHPITVHISTPDLKRIDYYGTGDISSMDTLRFPDIAIEVFDGMGSINLTLKSNRVSLKEHLGAADVTLKGITYESYYYLISEGWFYLDQLISKNVHVTHGGFGDISLFASQTLQVDKYSYGDINFYGNPTVTIISDKGSGSINKK